MTTTPAATDPNDIADLLRSVGIREVAIDDGEVRILGAGKITALLVTYGPDRNDFELTIRTAPLRAARI